VLDGPRADRALGTSCASWKARASLSSSGSPRSNRAHRLSEFRKEWRIPALTSKVRWDKFEEFRGVGDTGVGARCVPWPDRLRHGGRGDIRERFFRVARVMATRSNNGISALQLQRQLALGSYKRVQCGQRRP
jgi:hypothetical protein